MRDALEARPPEPARFRKIPQGAKLLFAERDELLFGIGRQSGRQIFSVKLPIASWITLPRSAAPGSASIGIKRPQPEHMLGVDRVGVAQPVLDVGNRELRRPRLRAAVSAPGAWRARPSPGASSARA